MKILKSVRLFYVFIVISMFPYRLMAQDSATIADAKSYLQAAIISLDNKNYPDAINNLLVSINQVPSAIAYYLLAYAYAKNGDPAHALQYANTTINTTPPLDSKYYKDLIKIRDWASSIENPPPQPSTPGVTASAVTGLELGFNVGLPPVSENPFSAMEQNSVPSTTSFTNRVVYFTSQSQYTAPVLNNNNTVVGYIIFFGFTSGRTVNGQTIASTFSIPLRRIIDGANMEWGNITYNATELYAGSVKTVTVGNITFKSIIVNVKKYDDNNYVMNSIQVQVTATVN